MTSRHSPDAEHERKTLRSLRALTVAAMLLVAPFAAYGQEGSPPAAPGGAAESPSPDAAALLAQAREKLAGYRTLKATMSETVEFGPRRFKAEGVYLQGTDNRVRVDVAVNIGENEGRLLQVADGDVLWTVYDVGKTPRITRRDINQILAAAKDADGKATRLAELGLGGLPALLASIEQSMTFKAPLSTEIDGRTFHVLEGEWKPEIRRQFEAQAQQLSAETTEPRPLPPHVPDFVRVYLDADTFFPYRIRYLKRGATPGAEPVPILTLDFRDIVVNASIEPIEFFYKPPADAQVADITSYYLQQIKGDTGQPAGGQAGTPATPPAGR